MDQTSPSRSHTGEVLSRRILSEKTFEMEVSRPPSFAFEAGQRITIQEGNTERDYSLASGPSDATLLLCIRHVKGGRLSPALADRETGARVHFTGPHGYFVFRSSARQPVFVATGTGIAPFVSMARAGCRGFMLLHGVQTTAELYYRDVFTGVAAAYLPCLSRASAQSQGRGSPFRGRVTDFMETRLASGLYDFYLCGREEMIRDAIHIVDRRFPGSHVYTEIFY